MDNSGTLHSRVASHYLSSSEASCTATQTPLQAPEPMAPKARGSTRWKAEMILVGKVNQHELNGFLKNQ